jgi:hypothetical protein
MWWAIRQLSSLRIARYNRREDNEEESIISPVSPLIWLDQDFLDDEVPCSWKRKDGCRAICRSNVASK